ncbi:MAG: glycosyltransferase family 2 protein [Planctomycetes bacterium]|nr:glycosyltransferase family 2 protein [Planctomycetota bacterium]
MVDVVTAPRENTRLDDLAVIFPAYNEEARIAEAVERALEVGAGRVVCVNDCSTDGTASVLGAYAEYAKVDVVHHRVNQGKQAAVKHGLQKALETEGLHRFATMDADMQDDPATLVKLGSVVGEYDMACSLRTRAEMPVVRRLANFLASAPYRFLARVNIHDVQAGYRVYSREVAECLAENLPGEGGYTLEHTSYPLFGWLAVERGRAFRIAEVPNPCVYAGSESHIKIRDNIQLTLASMRCAWQLSRWTRGQ